MRLFAIKYLLYFDFIENVYALLVYMRYLTRLVGNISRYKLKEGEQVSFPFENVFLFCVQ